RRPALRGRWLRRRLHGRRADDARSSEGAGRGGHGRGRRGQRHGTLLRMPHARGGWLTAMAAVVMAVSLSGCEQSPPPSAPRTSTAGVNTIASLKLRGDELNQRGQYEAALAVYEEALRQEPNDVQLRFAIATTLASLNRREEATEAFKWVAANGLPNSELVD